MINSYRIKKYPIELTGRKIPEKNRLKSNGSTGINNRPNRHTVNGLQKGNVKPTPEQNKKIWQDYIES